MLSFFRRFNFLGTTHKRLARRIDLFCLPVLKGQMRAGAIFPVED